jgi:hypothetical protein
MIVLVCLGVLGVLGGSVFDVIRVHPCSSVVSIGSSNGFAPPVISVFSVADAFRKKAGCAAGLLGMH